MTMLDENWTDSNGNLISVTDDHEQDERAPDTLKNALAFHALSLQRGLARDWDTKEVFLLALQRHCFDLLKEIKKHYTEYSYKEDLSRGVGADANSDGEVENAIHSFGFMSGRLATMIWEDGVSLNAGESDNGSAGDTILADSNESSSSSIPGGPGVRSAAERRRATAAACGVERHKPSSPVTRPPHSTLDSEGRVSAAGSSKRHHSGSAVPKRATSTVSKVDANGGSSFHPIAAMAQVQKDY